MNNMTQLLRITVSLLFVLFTFACGADEPRRSSNKSTANNSTANNSTPGCGDPNRPVTTGCPESFSGECTVGQYCDSMRLTCTIGCLSDANCASNQYCDLGDGAPGSCRTCPTEVLTPQNNDPQNNDPQNNDPQNNDPQNNDPQNNDNNEPTNNQSNQSSCESFCDHLINLCSELSASDRTHCIGVCGDYATLAERQCVINAPTCADADNCLEPIDDNNNNNNDTEVTDFGQVCTFNIDCQGNMCVFESQLDHTGYCSAPCNSWTECPTFWNCESVSGASGKFCVQD